ncbi:MAG: hypothetical protein ACK5NB_03020 [Flavobacteriaceae bacterium]
MLTESQHYISPNVYQTIKNEPEGYQNILIMMEPGDHPNYDFAYYELENHPRLELMLNMSESKEEFIANAYLFIEIQINFYEKEGVQYSIARELAQHELSQIYSNYNKLPISVE